jgi:hypothetical protein
MGRTVASRRTNHTRAALLAVAVVGSTALAVVPGAAASPSTASASAAPLSDCVSSDNGDPRLVGLRVTPAVDVTKRTKRVHFRVRARDTGGPGPAAGVRGVTVFFGHLPGDERFGFRNVRLSVNDAGVWIGSARVPRGSRDGIWRLGGVAFRDHAGNSRIVEPAELAAAGLPTGISVKSRPDRTPPRLMSLRFSPHILDTRRRSRAISFTARAADPQSAVGELFVRVSGVRFFGEAFGVDLHRVPGVAHLFRGRLSASKWAGSGTVHITGVFVANPIGDFRSYSGRQLDQFGVDREIRIRGVADRTEPRVVAFSRSPAAVDVRDVDRRVTFTVRAKDARAGLRSMSVGLGADEVRLHRVSGTRTDGIWRGRITVPRCASTSATKRLSILVSDRAGPFGNERFYGPAALASAGWPSQVDITAGDHRRPGVRLASFRIDPAASIGLRFTETVTGITASSVILRRVIGFSFPQRYGPVIPGEWVCADEAATDVDCATGTVRVATFTPTNALAAGRFYSVMFNPEHTLSVTDLAGNPFKRHEQILRTRR